MIRVGATYAAPGVGREATTTVHLGIHLLDDVPRHHVTSFGMCFQQSVEADRVDVSRNALALLGGELQGLRLE